MKSLRSLFQQPKGRARNASSLANRASERSFPEEPLDRPVEDDGGFYPGFIGEELNSRYQIVRKLGWGQHSNVWLAKDQLAPAYVAVKILSAHATDVQGRYTDEVGILRDMRQRQAVSTNPGKDHVLRLLDDFQVSSLHGPHICLVHPALGLYKRSLKGNAMPLSVVKAFTRQLLTALDFLHTECKVIHTDIKSDNILVALNRSDFEGKFEVDSAGPPGGSVSPAVVLSRPLHTYDMDQLKECLENNTLQVILSDFGVAKQVEGFHPGLIQPPALRAPEVIFGCPWGTPVDIWNLGCMTFEQLTGVWLFNPRAGPNYSEEQYHLGHMPGAVGEPFLFERFKDGKNYHKYCWQGSLRLNVANAKDLDTIIRSYQVLDEEQIPLAASFIRSMLRLNPDDRPDAKTLLNHEWLKE